MAIFKAKYKRFNGLDWDDFYFETTIDQVTGLQGELDGKAPTNHTHPINAIWTGSVYNIVNGLTPHMKSLFPTTKANKLAFFNPNAITIEGTDDGTTWTTLGYAPDRKVDIFSNKPGSIFFGNSLTSSPTGYTNNSKTRITIDQTLDGRYFGGWCNTVIEMSSSGAASPTVTIEVERKNVPGWHMIANKIPINGWSGINDIGHSNITFGSSFDGQDQKVRFTFEIGAVADGSTHGRAQVMNISAYGDSMWSATNHMSRSDNLYDYDYLQNAYFPAGIYSSGNLLATQAWTNTQLTTKLSTTGGIVTEKVQFRYTGASAYNNSNIELRERELVENTQSSDDYAPGIGFHWGGRYGRLLIMDSSGNLKWGGNKLATEPWVTSNTRSNTWVPSWSEVTSKPSWIGASIPTPADIGALPTSGGAMTGKITFNTTSTDNGFEWIVNSDSAGITFKNTGDGDTNSNFNFFTKDNGNEYFKFSHQHWDTGNKDFMDIKDGAVRINGMLYVNAAQSGDATLGTNALSGGTAVIIEGDARLTNSRPASNVKSWAIDGNGIVPSITDANDLLEVGFYHAENLTNAPTPGWYYYIVNRHDSGWISQEAISFGSGNTANRKYIRTKAGGTWSATWEEIATQDWTNTQLDSYVRSDGSSDNNSINIGTQNPGDGLGYTYVSIGKTLSGYSAVQILGDDIMEVNLPLSAYEGISANNYLMLNGKDVALKSTYLGISANRVLNTGDADRFIGVDNTSTINPMLITVPTNATQPIPVNSEIHIYRKGVGVVNIVAASGVTIESEGGKTSIANRYQAVTLKKIATNIWILIGALA